MSSTSSKGGSSSEDDRCELRRGPWTIEEDNLLVHYISLHGEGRWNLLAKRSGLKRTGKSCRLRWLNYLNPGIKRGNLTPQEQLLILDLHSKWGNRWSKIAQYLPGRTDNEIKNYWRTRVQRQARQLNVDPNSSAFQEIIRCCWTPRLLQKIPQIGQIEEEQMQRPKWEGSSSPPHKAGPGPGNGPFMGAQEGPINYQYCTGSMNNNNNNNPNFTIWSRDYYNNVDNNGGDSMDLAGISLLGGLENPDGDGYNMLGESDWYGAISDHSGGGDGLWNMDGMLFQ